MQSMTTSGLKDAVALRLSRNATSIHSPRLPPLKSATCQLMCSRCKMNCKTITTSKLPSVAKMYDTHGVVMPVHHHDHCPIEEHGPATEEEE